MLPYHDNHVTFSSKSKIHSETLLKLPQANLIYTLTNVVQQVKQVTHTLLFPGQLPKQ